MHKILVRFITACLTLVSLASAASELQDYVQQCETELGFNASDVQPMNCNDGVPFAGTFAGIENDVINDFLVYQRINSNVDLAVACRWLNNVSNVVGTKPTVPATNAASVELIIHNRKNASTCFFTAKEPNTTGDNFVITNVSVNIVSPTDFGTGHLNADDYWSPPSDLNTKRLISNDTGSAPLQCVGCHVAGPYIASKRIAPYLAQFGLLNNGHDTVADFTASKHYHAVGSAPYNTPLLLLLSSSYGAFGAWDSIIYKNIIEDASTHKPAADCSSACHSIGRNSTVGILTAFNENVQLLPSIQEDLAELTDEHLMPPADSNSDYRWINRSNAGGSGDWELLRDAQNEYPKLVCDSPTELQAHVVGSNDVFSTADPIPDILHTFDLQHGLMCLTSEQNGRACHDWQLRYKCDGVWTDWINNDNPGGNGDYERRSDSGYKNLCSSPTEMQARTIVNQPPPPRKGGTVVTFTAPNNRLFEFDPQHGLGCQNADQPDGKCSNYVVRFICPN